MNLLYRLLGGLLPGSLTQEQGSFWLPRQASTTAVEVDRVFQLVFWIAFVFFVLIVVLMTVFVLRYRKGRRIAKGEGPAHNTPLELTWTIIPLILVIVIFYAGFRTFLGMSVIPESPYEVRVTAQKWSWLFAYPNGHVDANLHVPVDTPIQLTMTSEDVIHSFFVPDFRMKRDIVPGRYNKAWFHATQPGEYQVYCAEYCGTSHSDMLASVIVHPPGEFEKWLANASDFVSQLPPAEAGERLYKQRGCAQCHSIDGKSGIGPTLRGLFGRDVPLKDGERAQADEDYIRESILEPQAKLVAGYDPVMPTYKGRLKDAEITSIIAYIKTLE